MIAIALAERPGTSVHLIDSNKKKAAFLREAQRVPGPAEVHAQRIEEFAHSFGASLDAVTARAVAPLKSCFDRGFRSWGKAAQWPCSRRDNMQSLSSERRARPDALENACDACAEPHRSGRPHCCYPGCGARQTSRKIPTDSLTAPNGRNAMTDSADCLRKSLPARRELPHVIPLGAGSQILSHLA